MKFLYTLFLSFLLFSINAQTVVDIIVNSEIHSTLETAIFEAELAEELGTEDSITVFAPTDAAFAAIDQAYLNELLDSPNDDLRKILRYHIIDAEVPVTGLSDGEKVQSLLGQMLAINISEDTVMINDAMLTVTDIVATNGIVHVIDAVLLPPANNVVDIIINSEAHEMLEDVMIEAQLNEPLSIGGPYTIFAPTDAAFAAMDIVYLQELLMDPTADLRKILRYHVVEDRIKSEDLFDEQIVTSALGQSLNINLEDGNIRVNNTLVTIKDIETFNGVVHVIDALILPPANTVVDVIVNSEEHTNLENGIVQAQLSDELSGEGPFTVFAPTDAAFLQIQPEILGTFFDDPTGRLKRLLAYHVLDRNETFLTLTNNDLIRTTLGQSVKISKTEEDLFVNDVLVSVKDIETFNGTVQVIDAVLMPPANNVLEVVVNSEDHTILEDAVYDAMLDDDLSANNYITLFAPTDAAFDNVDEDILNSILADPMGDLQDVLLHHVLDSEVLSEDLTDGQSFMTLANQEISVSLDDDIFINEEAMLTVSDIQTYNGTVHIIDEVLLPQLTAVNELNQVEVQVLPNPTADYLLVNLPEEMYDEEVNAQLINLAGSTIQSWVINNSATRLDVSNNVSGTYILLLDTDHEYARTKIIIKK